MTHCFLGILTSLKHSQLPVLVFVSYVLRNCLQNYSGILIRSVEAVVSVYKVPWNSLYPEKSNGSEELSHFMLSLVGDGMGVFLVLGYWV